jgi:hypothetical protein
VFTFSQEICTLCLAVIFNGDQLTFINFMGLVLCFTGIICHVAFKIARTTKGESEASVSTVNPVSGGVHPGGVRGCCSSSSGVTPTNAPLTGLFSKDKESETPLLSEKGEISRDSDDENDLWNR